MPVLATPPYARIPTYITAFQSSPVRIYETRSEMSWLFRLNSTISMGPPENQLPEKPSANSAKNCRNYVAVCPRDRWSWICRRKPAIEKNHLVYFCFSLTVYELQMLALPAFQVEQKSRWKGRGGATKRRSIESSSTKTQRGSTGISSTFFCLEE